MKVFTRDYRITGDYHPLWHVYFGDLKPCVLDIETTGLSPSRCKVVLIGFLMQTDSGVRITQFLAENHYEEPKVLEAALDFLARNEAGYFVTYNGAAFDVPFINERLRANFGGCESSSGGRGENSSGDKSGADIPAPSLQDDFYDAGRLSFDIPSLKLYDFDLYRFLRKCTDLKSYIGSLSQKSVEDHYGILSDRGDTITGRESVMLFDKYALTGSSTLEKIILTHNREDVLHLHRLMFMAMADVCDLHSAIGTYGFPAAGGSLSVRPRIKKSGRSQSCGPQSFGSQSAAMFSIYEDPASSSASGSTLSVTDGEGCLNVCGEQIARPVSCAYFPYDDSPLTVSFSASSSSFEIETPVCFRGSDCFMDISFLSEDDTVLSEYDADLPKDDPATSKDDAALYENGAVSSGTPGAAEFSAGSMISVLRSDPDCINDFLILNPRTVNLVSRLLAEVYYRRRM